MYARYARNISVVIFFSMLTGLSACGNDDTASIEQVSRAQQCVESMLSELESARADLTSAQKKADDKDQSQCHRDVYSSIAKINGSYVEKLAEHEKDEQKILDWNKLSEDEKKKYTPLVEELSYCRADELARARTAELAYKSDDNSECEISAAMSSTKQRLEKRAIRHTVDNSKAAGVLDTYEMPDGAIVTCLTKGGQYGLSTTCDNADY